MQKVKQLVDSAKPLAPLAPSAVAASPLLLLAAPSVGAMIFATEAPPVQVENCTIDCGSFYIPPPTIEDQSQKQQNQTQNQGQSNEQKKDPEPQTATDGAGKKGGKRPGDFTPSQRDEAIGQNAKVNGGKNRCEKCGQTLVRTQNKPGQKAPANQLHVHHNPPIHKGGGQHSKRQVVCRTCHVRIHK
jgi:hypothetical protein